MLALQTEVVKKIKEIKSVWPEPQCFLLACILAGNYGGVIWYNGEHCITLINGRFYDKGGPFATDRVTKERYIPLYEYGVQAEAALVNALIHKHGQYK